MTMISILRRRAVGTTWNGERPMTAAAAGNARPRVLCIVDRPRWAHDRKTASLAEALAKDYEIVTRYQAEVTVSDIDGADLVLLYYWLQYRRLPWRLRRALKRARERLLIGVCSVRELEGRLRAPGTKLLASLPRAVFANNLAMTVELEHALGRRVFYTPNGVDTTFFHPATPSPVPPLRAGWAGSLKNHGSAHRGLTEFVMPAVASLDGVELHLAAREDRWRDADEMRVFHQSLHVYVCASASEGTPNGCLEAAASGLAIVTTPVGNMPELIRDGENGLLVSRNVEEITAALRRLRDEPGLRERLGRAAREDIEAWDWSRQATRYAAMFGEMLA
jgi:glycosyltransferase involved in cell wall biosynthesis